VGRQSAVRALVAERITDTSSERLEALFQAHSDRLYRLARRLTRTSDEARDLVQDTFLRAASSVKSVPAGLRAEEAWLVRVLVNIQRDRWRKSAVRKRLNAAVVAATHIEPFSDGETALIARTDVWRALDRLPPRRRAVVILCELEGLSISAIASLLGIAAITVRWHLARGRHDLARILNTQTGGET
jgi:RNA polymerase sigma-70 factor (ECF subfamily)